MHACRALYIYAQLRISSISRFISTAAIMSSATAEIGEKGSLPLPMVEIKDPPPPYHPEMADSYKQVPVVIQQAPVVMQQQPVVLQQTRIVGVPPRDYLILSIFSTFCCFWPIGVFALIKSVEVRSSIASGDLLAARSASRSALTFNKVAILIGSILTAVVVAVIIVSRVVQTVLVYSDE